MSKTPVPPEGDSHVKRRMRRDSAQVSREGRQEEARVRRTWQRASGRLHGDRDMWPMPPGAYSPFFSSSHPPLKIAFIGRHF